MGRTTIEKIQIAYDALYKYGNIHDVSVRYNCEPMTVRKYINEFKDEVTEKRMSEIGQSNVQKIPQEDKDDMYRMYEEGKSYSDIAEALGFKRKSVYNIILDYRHKKESEGTVTKNMTIDSDESKIINAIEDYLYQIFDLFETLKNYKPQEEK